MYLYLYLAIGFRPCDGGESIGIGRIGMDEIVHRTQQRNVQQSVAGDKLLAVSAGWPNAKKRIALRSRADARTGRNAWRDQWIFELDVLGKLQRAVFSVHIRDERSRRYGETLRKLVRTERRTGPPNLLLLSNPHIKGGWGGGRIDFGGPRKNWEFKIFSNQVCVGLETKISRWDKKKKKFNKKCFRVEELWRLSYYVKRLFFVRMHLCMSNDFDVNRELEGFSGLEIDTPGLGP